MGSCSHPVSPFTRRRQEAPATRGRAAPPVSLQPGEAAVSASTSRATRQVPPRQPAGPRVQGNGCCTSLARQAISLLNHSPPPLVQPIPLTVLAPMATNPGVLCRASPRPPPASTAAAHLHSLSSSSASEHIPHSTQRGRLAAAPPPPPRKAQIHSSSSSLLFLSILEFSSSSFL